MKKYPSKKNKKHKTGVLIKIQTGKYVSGTFRLGTNSLLNKTLISSPIEALSRGLNMSIKFEIVFDELENKNIKINIIKK